MSYIRESFFRGREWASLEEMQTAAIVWCVEVAGQRRHRSLGGAAPAAVFTAVEQPALLAMPRQRFEAATWSRPKVGTDCHINVSGALYSVPWRHIGQHFEARKTPRLMEAFVGPDLIKTHPAVIKGVQTDWNDYPPEKAAFFKRTPVWCRRRAAELGPDVAALVEDLMAVNALHRLRSCQGVIGLADKHAAARLNAACRRAIEVGDPTYRTVKGILAAGTDTDTTSNPEPPVAPAHLHGARRLFDPDHPTSDPDSDCDSDLDSDCEVAS